jgi:ethanolamine ammonia-lyase small subunit
MSRAPAPDPWHGLRQWTPARIALGRAGDSLPTRTLLELGLAQARARDAVHEPAHTADLLERLGALGWDALAVHSAAADRRQYLLRPDLGRRLDEPSRARLQARAGTDAPDVGFVIADGLSSQATRRHALPLLENLLALAPAGAPPRWRPGPLVVAELARVALGDEIGERLRARQVVILIGERPGLSAPDSMGIYLTHAPRVGRTDAERNCISNVRPEGLGYAAAARRLAFLMDGARRLGASGLVLKDDSDAAGLPTVV